MPPTELLAQPICQAVTWALVHFLWQGLLVAGGYAAAVELLAVRKPAARYAWSLAALLVMVACPLATGTWLLSGGPDTATIAPAHTPSVEIFPAAAIVPEPQWTVRNLAAAQPYLLIAWLAGVGFFGCRLLFGLAGLQQLRAGRGALPGHLACRVELLGRRFGLPARRLVFMSRRVSEAMAMGLLRPIVLIPAAWATEIPAEMLEAVIAHELAHLRRHDLWVNLLQRLVETLLFYHPAVWWLSWRLRVERELCCDELAVAVTGQRLTYVEALAHVARGRAGRARPVLAAGIRGEKNMRLLERVRNVLGFSSCSERSFWPAGLLALALPLGAWIYATGLVPTDKSAAIAADDREDDDDDDDDDRDERKEAKDVRKDDEREDRDADEKKPGKVARDDDDDKEGDEREDTRREKKEAADKDDGDEKREGRKAEDRKDGARKDGDHKEVQRKEGDRKDDLRDGERSDKKGPRDGDVRKHGPRDGDVRKEGTGESRIEQLMAAVKKLTAENQRLRAELAEIRNVHDGDRKHGADHSMDKAAREKDEAFRKREAAVRKKEAAESRAAEEKERAARERKFKAAEGVRAEGAERKEIEARQRKIKEAAAREAQERASRQ